MQFMAPPGAWQTGHIWLASFLSNDVLYPGGAVCLAHLKTAAYSKTASGGILIAGVMTHMPENAYPTSENTVTAPPVAVRKPHPTTLHGVTLEDDYFWLREKSSPEVLEYLNAENDYTDAAMEPTRPLQETLYREMLSHIKETDTSVPYRQGRWLYWNRTVEGMQYPLYCRRSGDGVDSAGVTGFSVEELAESKFVFLDVNELAEGKAFMQLGGLAVSPDGNVLAYSTDETGFRQYTLHIRDLRTGEDLRDTAERVGSMTWAAELDADGVADGIPATRTLFYTTEDEQTKRHDRLYRHTLGDTAAQDTLVLHETDERFNLGVGKTRDGKLLIVEAASHTTSEARYIPAETPTAEPILIAARVDDQEYSVDHRDGVLYIRTNDVGREFRLIAAPLGTPGRPHWQEILPLTPGVPLEDVDLFRNFAVIERRVQGLPTLSVRRFDDAGMLLPEEEAIDLPDPVYDAGAHVNREFDATTWRYSYQSLARPASVYSYDLATRTSSLLKQQEVPGGFDASLYRAERLWIDAQDGTEVPVSLVYRIDSFARAEHSTHTGSDAQHGANPLYVYGYGSYGYPLPIGFSTSRLSLLDRGIVVAYAHIRGGGDLGDTWHDAGKMQVKRNTFTDFVDVVDALVTKGYGDRRRVAIEGGSAGGLLMGAVVNLRPELFHVVLSHVPFVDVMNTMLDATLPLTVAEYEEWGNPNEPEAFQTMLAYSPYDQLKPAAYPAMLVKTSLNDSQVMYWEPAKYVAKLRTLKQDQMPLLLHINMEAGHGGASGRYDYLKETAFDYAFLLTQLGVA
jgi:oligopeptidase B